MEELELFAKLVVWLEVLATVVGGASIMFKGIEVITKVTPSDKDDIFVGKMIKGIAWLQTFLDKLALNPKAR
jgi:hypothetical protein